MIKFKPVIRKKRILQDGTTLVNIRICFNHKTRYVSSGYYVMPKNFDKKEGKIKAGGSYTQDLADRANAKIQIQIGVMADKMLRQEGVGDIKELLELLRDKRTNYDLIAALNDRIEKYKKTGNKNYQINFETTKSKIKKFTGENLIPFKSINYGWLKRFEDWVLTGGGHINSVGSYIRNIRTVFNEAITIGKIDQSLYPFRKYKIPKQITRKRNLNAEEMSRIIHLEIKSPLTRWARDMFVLSFYLLGINIKDLMTLEKVESGRIYYIRSKGKKPYSVKVFPEAQEIINRYPGGKFLLDTDQRYKYYQLATRRINFELIDIANECGISSDISTYWARHSWATIASSIGISEDIIARALGHTISNQMTIIYIDFNLEKVDEANRKVIDHVLKTPPSGQNLLP